MHGRRRSPHNEYEWRPRWANGAGSLLVGSLSGAPRGAVAQLRQSILSRNDEGCKKALDRLPRATEERHQRRDEEQPHRSEWERIVPPYFRVAHEAVCGEEGIFHDLGLSALDVVRFLHINGAPMDAQNADGRTPLWIASDLGKIDVIRYLVNECGASTNTRDLGGWTPLNAAVEHRDADAVSILVKDGNANVNTRDVLGFTPLHASAEEGWLDMVRLLRNFGADVDTPCNEGNTALHAMAQGYWVVRRNHANTHRCTALDGVKFLTAPSCNANVHVRNNDGRSPLMIGMQNSWHHHKFELGRYLHEECGGDICFANSLGSALHTVDYKIDQVRYLIERGVNPQWCNYEGDTPVHSIISTIRTWCGDHNNEPISMALEVIRFLVSEECISLSPNGYKADINALNGEGLTPLLQLVTYYREPKLIIEPLKVLVDDLGAAVVGVSDFDGNTALHLSVIHSRNSNYCKSSFDPVVLEKLLSIDGVDVNARDNLGLTPLNAVVQSNHSDGAIADIVKFLCSHGASINTMDNNSWTPLHAAASRGLCKVAQALVEQGAELDTPDHNGLSPLQLAESRMRRSRDLPRDYHHMSNTNLYDWFYPVVKYLRSAGSTVPTWWSPTNLVGRILSNESQSALESFANTMNSSSSSSRTSGRRPHVSHIVYAQRLLEGASMHGTKVESVIRDSIAAGDVGGAAESLMKATVQIALRTQSTCSICSEQVCGEARDIEEAQPVAEQNQDVAQVAPSIPNDMDHCTEEEKGAEKKE
eukprot:15364873-Ditylum_brightwellii.AAC.1